MKNTTIFDGDYKMSRFNEHKTSSFNKHRMDRSLLKEKLASSLLHSVGFSELPIYMNSRVPFLEKLLTNFYKTLDKRDSVIARQKTLGGCKLDRLRGSNHYILAFSGNNEFTFHLHEKLQAFLDAESSKFVAQERCVSPPP